MPGKDQSGRRPDEHYQPVALSRSSQESKTDAERIRKLSGGARATAERIARRKRANRRAMTGK